MKAYSEWNVLPISELYEALYDGPHATPKTSDVGPVFLGIKNVTNDGHLDFSDVRHISEDDFVKWTRRVEPRPGDIVFTYEATLNRYAMIPPRFRGCLGRRMALIRTNAQKVDGKFLFYYFFSPAWREVIANNMISGATVDRIPLVQFSKFPVRVPSLGLQRKIAEILSAYDDLIESSQRRIRILETMARSLYRECFVDFRFPGHEKARRAPSVLGENPEGWELATLGILCGGKSGVQTGPFGSQLHESDYSETGVPVVMPKDLIGFRVRTDSIARVSESTASKLARHRMQAGDIVYGRRGDIGRRAFITEGQAGWLCGTGCLRIRPDPGAINGWYLFNYLGQEDVLGVIAGRAQGVTMPNLNTGVMASLPIRLPPRSLQEDFARLSLPFAAASEMLTTQMDILRKLRDLQLPRLLSGQASLPSD